MTDLFRYMVLRAPETPSQNTTIQIDGSNPSPLIADLKTASATATPQASMAAVAQRYIAQKEQFVATPDSLSFGNQYHMVFDALQLAATSRTDAKTLASVTHSVFPKPAQVVADKRFLDDKRRVHDSLLALQVAPYADTSVPARLVNICRHRRA